MRKFVKVGKAVLRVLFIRPHTVNAKVKGRLVHCTLRRYRMHCISMGRRGGGTSNFCNRFKFQIVNESTGSTSNRPCPVLRLGLENVVGVRG